MWQELDCSQSLFFPCDRRCRCGSLNASETGESTICPWVGVVEGTGTSIFSALSPHAINPTTPTQGHFVLSPVSLASRDQDDRPVELNDRHRHLRSHGKIRDCEQSRQEHTTIDWYFYPIGISSGSTPRPKQVSGNSFKS